MSIKDSRSLDAVGSGATATVAKSLKELIRRSHEGDGSNSSCDILLFRN
jgi:hypothetical protein